MEVLIFCFCGSCAEWEFWWDSLKIYLLLKVGTYGLLFFLFLYLSSLSVVFLFMLKSGRLSESVRKNLQSWNLPWHILRLIEIPLWKILCHLEASGEIITLWNTSRFHASFGSASGSSSLLINDKNENLTEGSWDAETIQMPQKKKVPSKLRHTMG